MDTKYLAQLRKETGFGLSLCREALLESNNDINAAQLWLDERAIKKGWQKSEKLQGRKTAEGLIGVMVENNHAAMVEVCITELDNLGWLNITYYNRHKLKAAQRDSENHLLS